MDHLCTTRRYRVTVLTSSKCVPLTFADIASIDCVTGKLPMTPKKTAFCWAHVDDVALAHLLAMEKGRAGESYIIAGPPHTFIEALEIAERITGKKPPCVKPGPATMKAMADNLPPGITWAGFGIGRMQMPMVAQAMLLGGHVRVGLEDNIWLDRGVHASNGQLVERAIEIIERLGGRALSPAEGREKMKLKRRD